MDEEKKNEVVMVKGFCAEMTTKEVGEKEIWPPISPDCYPLEFFLWSMCKLCLDKAPKKILPP